VKPRTPEHHKIFPLIVGTFATTLVIFSPTVAYAKTADEIYEIARTRSVLIRMSSGSSGSGVIINRKGNTYTVLTNHHVACGANQDIPTAITYDDESHPGQVLRCFMKNQARDPDLALIVFEAKKDYPKAVLANSSQVRIGSSIYVYGFPAYLVGSGISNDVEPQFSPGYVTNLSKSPVNGYGVSYSATTWRGMSGGPVFDSDGRVVAIHGRARTATREVYDKNLTQTGIAVVETGFNLGIPVNTFITAAKSETNLASLVVSDVPAGLNQLNLLTPQSSEDYYVRGLSFADQGNHQDAIENFNQALILSSINSDIYLKRGLSYYALGDFQKALMDVNQTIKLNPTSAIAYNSRGAIYFKRRDFQRSLEDFTKATEINSAYALAYANRGSASAMLGSLDDAVRAFNRSIELDASDAYTYYSRGLARWLLRDNKGAIEDYSNAVALNPKLATAYNERGLARRNLNDQKGAIEDYTIAISLDPKMLVAYINRGEALSKLGKYKEAIEDFNYALKIRPDYYLAYLGRGTALEKLRDFKAAIEDFSRVIKLEPQMAAGYHERGRTRSLSGDKLGASEDLKKAAELYRQSGDVTNYNLVQVQLSVLDLVRPK
jgi:tetratricopeptide (TPR) repeat protein